MTDITKCKGENCVRKDTCWRYVAPADKYRQSWSDYDHDSVPCSSYWPIMDDTHLDVIEHWRLVARNAERARDEADAHRNRIEAELEAELKAAKDCVSFNSYRAMEADLAAARALLREARNQINANCSYEDEMILVRSIDAALGKDAK